MTKSHVTPTMFALSPVEHPRCPSCQIRMALAAIHPGPAGHDYRTFECVKCDHSETAIADDPTKSEKASWPQSELKPPQ